MSSMNSLFADSEVTMKFMVRRICPQWS